MRGRSYALAVCAMVVLGSTVFASPGAHAITGEACNQPIVVARLGFGPGTVPRGHASTARLSGRNCTRHPRAVTIQWTAKFSGNGAVNCPVIDPLIQKLTVPASSALTASLRYVVPAKCTAKLLTASTRVTDDKSGHLIRNKTATLRIIQPHAS